mmetsp:Transcript_10464/g.18485  ORF Transcript_10464/g.18485 Transcript_10464/m.18485 type:complete len:708 (-) Transcript_10464:398-2521(-)
MSADELTAEEVIQCREAFKGTAVSDVDQLRNVFSAVGMYLEEVMEADLYRLLKAGGGSVTFDAFLDEVRSYRALQHAQAAIDSKKLEKDTLNAFHALTGARSKPTSGTQIETEHIHKALSAVGLPDFDIAAFLANEADGPSGSPTSTGGLFRGSSPRSSNTPATSPLCLIGYDDFRLLCGYNVEPRPSLNLSLGGPVKMKPTAVEVLSARLSSRKERVSPGLYRFRMAVLKVMEQLAAAKLFFKRCRKLPQMDSPAKKPFNEVCAYLKKEAYRKLPKAHMLTTLAEPRGLINERDFEKRVSKFSSLSCIKAVVELTRALRYSKQFTSCWEPGRPKDSMKERNTGGLDGYTVGGSPDASVDVSVPESFMSQRYPDKSVSSLGLSGGLAASQETIADSKLHRRQSTSGPEALPYSVSSHAEGTTNPDPDGIFSVLGADKWSFKGLDDTALVLQDADHAAPLDFSTASATMLSADSLTRASRRPPRPASSPAGARSRLRPRPLSAISRVLEKSLSRGSSPMASWRSTVDEESCGNTSDGSPESMPVGSFLPPQQGLDAISTVIKLPPAGTDSSRIRPHSAPLRRRRPPSSPATRTSLSPKPHQSHISNLDNTVSSKCSAIPSRRSASLSRSTAELSGPRSTDRLRLFYQNDPFKKAGCRDSKEGFPGVSFKNITSCRIPITAAELQFHQNHKRKTVPTLRAAASNVSHLT